MAQKNRNPETAIEVDGEAYVWRIQRLPQRSGKPTDWRGLAIAVRHQEGQREAILEFPAGPAPRRGSSSLIPPPQVEPDVVATAIASAIVAGWDPLSRGKSVTYAVDEAGG
jgi:hypothetical protein